MRVISGGVAGHDDGVPKGEASGQAQNCAGDSQPTRLSFSIEQLQRQGCHDSGADDPNFHDSSDLSFTKWSTCFAKMF
jgi:hypothetical protein